MPPASQPGDPGQNQAPPLPPEPVVHVKPASPAAEANSVSPPLPPAPGSVVMPASLPQTPAISAPPPTPAKISNHDNPIAAASEPISAPAPALPASPPQPVPAPSPTQNPVIATTPLASILPPTSTPDHSLPFTQPHAPVTVAPPPQMHQPLPQALPVRPATNNAQPNARSGLVKHHFSLKILLLVAGSSVLILGSLIAWALVVNAAPDTVAAAFTSDMLAGQTDQAYALTSSDFQNTTAKSDFSIYVQQFATFPQQKPKQVNRRTGRSGNFSTATITESIKGNDGKQQLLTMTLVKVGKTWKVYNVAR